MTKRRQRYSAQFKFQGALEAAGELKTINQIASEHGVHPNQVSQWKKQLLEEGPTVFINGRTRPNQVWCSDTLALHASACVTYLPMDQGFMYLVAIMDWFSRYVLAWQLSNTLDSLFCLMALHQALDTGVPEIFNTDQGAQFTAQAFTTCLQEASIRISMDGRGRAVDNIFVERLWRTVKYEDVYLKEYATVPALYAGLESYFGFYNTERPHQSLAYRTPAVVHFGC
jgi:putative transposase